MPLSSFQGFFGKGNERGGLANGSPGGSCGISAHAPNLFASARRRRLNRAIAKTRVAAIGSFGVCVCPCVLAQFDDVAFGRFMFAWQSPTGTVQEMLQTPHPLLRWTDGGVARTRGTTTSGDGSEGEADSAHRANVEVCTTIQVVKYSYKYMYKGPDGACSCLHGLLPLLASPLLLAQQRSAAAEGLVVGGNGRCGMLVVKQRTASIRRTAPKRGKHRLKRQADDRDKRACHVF